MLLGEFKGDDKLVVWTSKNQYYITGYDLGQHFPDDTVRVNRYEPDRVYSVCYFDREQGYYYMKRFSTELTDRMQYFLDEGGQADLVCVTDVAGAKLEITYKGAHAQRPADLIDVDDFVGVKSHRAKGKRLTTYEVATLRFIEPELPPEPDPDEEGSPADGEGADSAAHDTAQTARDTVQMARDTAAEHSGAATAAGKAAATRDRKSDAEPQREVDAAGLPPTGSPAGGVPFEIERARGDADEVASPEQLNLF